MIRRLLAWLFTSRSRRLELRAAKLGRLTLQQTDTAEGVGWTCSLRPKADWDNPRAAPTYAWMAEGRTIEEAISNVLAAVSDAPNQKKIDEGRVHARLGGREFDE